MPDSALSQPTKLPNLSYMMSVGELRYIQANFEKGAAKNPDQLDAVIRNTFIQGTLSIVFAVLVLIVFAAGIIMALKAFRGGGLPLSEDDGVASRIFAPSGMIPTKAEKEVQKQWDELPKSHVKSVGTGAH